MGGGRGAGRGNTGLAQPMWGSARRARPSGLRVRVEIRITEQLSVENTHSESKAVASSWSLETPRDCPPCGCPGPRLPKSPGWSWTAAAAWQQASLAPPRPRVHQLAPSDMKFNCNPVFRVTGARLGLPASPCRVCRRLLSVAGREGRAWMARPGHDRPGPFRPSGPPEARTESEPRGCPTRRPGRAPSTVTP